MGNRLPGEQRRREIAEATLKIIADEGLRGFTTAGLSQEVGIAEGTIFRHFSSKEEIVLAAIQLAEEMLSGQFLRSDLDPIERLGRFVVARVRLIRTHRGLFHILFSNQLAQVASEDGAERIDALKQRSLQFVRSCLHDAARQDLLAPGIDPNILSFVVHGTALSLIFHPGTDADAPALPTPEGVWATLERLICRSKTGS